MNSPFPPQERKRIAAATGTSDAYFYQCLTGLRDMSPITARELENKTGGVVKRWHVCTKTWHLIWPELIGQEGAPKVSEHV